MIEKSYQTVDGRVISYCDNEAFDKKTVVFLHILKEFHPLIIN